MLDYVPQTNTFYMKVPRSNSTLIQELINDHGFDFSIPASTQAEAFLFTHEPYAACAFIKDATPRARERLGPYIREIEASWRATSKAHIRCPADKELWGFQKADIEYALRRRNTLIGDQPGLGKTPVGICFANEVRARRVLVICPASIRLQWVKRIYEWTTMYPRPHVHCVLNSKRGISPTAEWTVLSYDLARLEPIGLALEKEKFDVIILDEAHYLKTPDSLRTRAIFGGGESRKFRPIVGGNGYVLALTGTPLPNRPREAYTLARAMCFDSIDWLSEEGFKSRFNPSRRMERVDPRTGQTVFYIDERSGRHAELQSRLRANFMCRHLKRDVMDQLRMPVYDIIQLEETGPVKQALKAERLLDIDPENLAGADAAALGHVAVVRRMMGEALAPQVADYIDMLIDGGEEKLVVFAWHISVLNYLEKRLQRHGVLRIDGSTSSAQKEARIESFIQDPQKQVIIGNMQSMGIGTDGLQKVACHALIAEASWTPSDNEQAFDRLDRGGQTRQVQGDIFVAPNSFAERVLAASLRKHQTTHKALDKRH